MSFDCKNMTSKLLQLQILDFGLARHTENEMTGYVATRWYRAPEIMLNWMHYRQNGISKKNGGCLPYFLD